MRRCFKYQRNLLPLCWFVSIGVCSAPLSFMLVSGEGGSQAYRSTFSFEEYMAERGCDVKVSFVNNNVNGSVLYFSAKPLSIPLVDSKKYQRLAKIKTYQNEPLTSAVLIKASTGVSDLKSVEGERLSVVSKRSYLGWSKIEMLYNDAGVSLDKNDIYEAGTYEGAIALLLHGDVFVAGLPGPLAKRWATANNLSIIAESEALSVGDVWIRGRVSDDQKQDCKEALVSLTRTNRRDKRMSVFPAWVEGFK